MTSFRAWPHRHSGADASGADASGADAAGMDAVGADVGGADAAGMDAVGADASGADAAGMDAVGADVGGADVGGADVSGADVSGADVSGADVSGADGGSAVVEFLTLGMLMLLPLVYLVFAMGRVQAASYAADGSAREAARAFVTADTDEEGERRALAAVRLGLLDQGFDEAPADVLRLDCDATPCLRPGARVVARVEVDVVLPGVPAFLDRAVPVRVTVRSAQVAVVDEFRPARTS